MQIYGTELYQIKVMINQDRIILKRVVLLMARCEQDKEYINSIGTELYVYKVNV